MAPLAALFGSVATMVKVGPLRPSGYTSLGAMTPNSGTYTIDTTGPTSSLPDPLHAIGVHGQLDQYRERRGLPGHRREPAGPAVAKYRHDRGTIDAGVANGLGFPGSDGGLAHRGD